MIEKEKEKIQSVQSKKIRETTNVELSSESNKKGKLTTPSLIKAVGIDTKLER